MTSWLLVEMQLQNFNKNELNMNEAKLLRRKLRSDLRKIIIQWIASQLDVGDKLVLAIANTKLRVRIVHNIF